MAVRIKDIASEELEILNAANAVVCSVKMARGAVADSADEETEEAEAEAEA